MDTRDIFEKDTRFDIFYSSAVEHSSLLECEVTSSSNSYLCFRGACCLHLQSPTNL